MEEYSGCTENLELIHRKHREVHHTVQRECAKLFTYPPHRRHLKHGLQIPLWPHQHLQNPQNSQSQESALVKERIGLGPEGSFGSINLMCFWKLLNWEDECSLKHQIKVATQSQLWLKPPKGSSVRTIYISTLFPDYLPLLWCLINHHRCEGKSDPILKLIIMVCIIHFGPTSKVVFPIGNHLSKSSCYAEIPGFSCNSGNYAVVVIAPKVFLPLRECSVG